MVQFMQLDSAQLSWRKRSTMRLTYTAASVILIWLSLAKLTSPLQALHCVLQINTLITTV